MRIKLYDSVIFQDGRKASVVEILGNRELLICDVENGTDYDTVEIRPEQIKEVRR